MSNNASASSSTAAAPSAAAPSAAAESGEDAPSATRAAYFAAVDAQHDSRAHASTTSTSTAIAVTDTEDSDSRVMPPPPSNTTANILRRSARIKGRSGHSAADAAAIIDVDNDDSTWRTWNPKDDDTLVSGSTAGHVVPGKRKRGEEDDESIESMPPLGGDEIEVTLIGPASQASEEQNKYVFDVSSDILKDLRRRDRAASSSETVPMPAAVTNLLANLDGTGPGWVCTPSSRYTPNGVVLRVETQEEHEELVTWSYRVDLWNQRFKELVQYKTTYGDCNVPQKLKENRKLAHWVRAQRTKYRLLMEGKPSPMTEDRIRKLEGIRFDWSPHADSWNTRYDELVQYKTTYGNCKVPQKWKENPKLASWVDLQRRNYRLLMEGKPSPMTKDRIRKLEGIGFEWSPNTVTWSTRYDELVQYRSKYGDCRVPPKWKENQKLARWVSNQKIQYRLLMEGKPSCMTKDRIRKLEGIGFEWSPNTVTWSTRYDELVQYRSKYGDCNVPRNWKETRKLAHWVMAQRQHYRLLMEGKPSSMTKDRIRKLKGIGFEWSVRTRKH